MDADKREQIIRAAREWIRRTDHPWQHVRFDIVTVLDQPEPHLTHHRNAF